MTLLSGGFLYKNNRPWPGIHEKLFWNLKITWNYKKLAIKETSGTYITTYKAETLHVAQISIRNWKFEKELKA